MIACTNNLGAPVLIGDLLISDTQKPDSFILPTLSDNVIGFLNPATSRYPILLSQKIYILKPNVCVAFAGSVAAIKLFLEDLKRLCAYHETITSEHINSFLDGYDHSELPKEDLSFIILVSGVHGGELGVVQFTRGDGITGNFDNFGKVTALGSGGEAFITEVSEAGRLNSKFEPGSVAYAIQINTILISKILSKERASLNTVSKHWGAGFQVIYLNTADDTFNKVDDITYIINHGHMDEKGEFGVPIPTIVLRYKYHDDILVITAIAADYGEREVNSEKIIVRYRSFGVTQFVVAPIDLNHDVDLSQFSTDTSFISFKNAMGYILKTKTGKYLPASFVIGPEITVDYKHRTSLTITMFKQVNDSLQESVRNNFANR